MQLTQEDSQQNNRQDDRQHQQQTTRLTPCISLIPRSLPEFPVRATRILVGALHILSNPTQLLTLLGDDLRNLLEQHVEITHALLDVLDLLLALCDEGVLKVDLVLGGKPQILLQLRLLLLRSMTWRNCTEVRALLFVSGGGSCSRDGRALFFEGLALEELELVERGLELAEELLLLVFLRGLGL